jgi:D-alanine-D-alanine ligase-like ATP-grasp enzyme/acylphosphatase
VSFPPPPRVSYRGQAANTYDEVAYVRGLGADGAKGSVLEREALMRGLATTRFSKGAFLASDGTGPPLCFRWSRSPLSSAVSLGLCTHKEATRMRLQQQGVPVPEGRTFANGDYVSAEGFAGRIGYPVVVKPATGVRGIAVVANIRGPGELRRAFTQLEASRFRDGDFIVEKHIPGRDYRIVVIDDRVIAAVLREPACVEGDGEHTVGQLIVNKNAVRSLNPHLLSRLIKFGDAARHHLDRAGLTLASVPAPGQRVLLSDSCSLSQGGDSIDVLDELHPSVRDACLRAVRAVPGMWFCGVDFLLEDHTRSLGEQEAGICELNAHAAISNCQYPLYGTPRNVARTFIEQCIERFGLATNDKPAERLALRLTIRGRVTRTGYRAWMKSRAETSGVAGWVRNVDPHTVEAVVIGDAVPVSALVAAAIRGPRRASPVTVSAEHIDPLPLEQFEIRRDGQVKNVDAG